MVAFSLSFAVQLLSSSQNLTQKTFAARLDSDIFQLRLRKSSSAISFSGSVFAAPAYRSSSIQKVQ